MPVGNVWGWDGVWISIGTMSHHRSYSLAATRRFTVDRTQVQTKAEEVAAAAKAASSFQFNGTSVGSSDFERRCRTLKALRETGAAPGTGSVEVLSPLRRFAPTSSTWGLDATAHTDAHPLSPLDTLNASSAGKKLLGPNAPGKLAGELQLGAELDQTMGVLLTSEALRSKSKVDAAKIGRYTHAGEWQSPYRKQRFDADVRLVAAKVTTRAQRDKVSTSGNLNLLREKIPR